MSDIDTYTEPEPTPPAEEPTPDTPNHPDEPSEGG